MTGHGHDHGAAPAASPNQTEYLKVHLSHDGLLPSHVYLGSSFFVLGAWWLVAVLKLHYSQKRLPSSLSVAGKCGLCSGKLMEGVVKLAACVIGIIVEAITVNHLGRPSNYTYTTVYAAFLLAALVDIFIGLGVVLPEGIDYMAHAVGFSALAAIARSHAIGHLHLTVATRMATSYIAIFAVLLLAADLYKPQSLVVKMMRTSAVMLQGVWFWQAGLVLDSPFAGRWEETDHANLMFITIAFAWDMFGVLLFHVFFAVAMGKLFWERDADGNRRRYRTEMKESVRGKQTLEVEPVDDYKPLQTTEVVEMDGGIGNEQTTDGI